MPYLKLLLLSLFTFHLQAQKRYWIDNAAIEKHPEILTEISPTYCSEWIGACSYDLTKNQLYQIGKTGLTITTVQTFFYKEGKSEPRLGFGLEQIKGHRMRAAGLNGKNIKIGVIDGGFGDLNRNSALQHLTENNQIIAYKNFFKQEDTLNDSNPNDTHGSVVLQLIAGFDGEKNIQFGLATDALFYLAKTDSDNFERRIEEDHLIAAMEWMHQQGVEILNISLGYARGFNDKEENYKPEQMDGKTTAVARAVEHAVLEEGMVIVVAAGNEANNLGWRIVSTPADARHALTVGSSKFSTWEQTKFSSTGPEFVDFVKPDVLAFSGSGTSFSAPIITGMAACIKQFNPELTNLEIIDIIHRAGHLYPYPNNHIGYGVPTCDRVMKILQNETADITRPEQKVVKGRKTKITIEKPGKTVILLHKSYRDKVLHRTRLKSEKANIRIRRYRKAHSTTVIFGDQAIEIDWM